MNNILEYHLINYFNKIIALHLAIYYQTEKKNTQLIVKNVYSIIDHTIEHKK